MRRHLLLPVTLLVLFCAATVVAQESLVEYNDKNDPCDRFKMRILIPMNNADHKFRIKKVEGGIDYKMVWNPCPQNEPQFAYVPLRPNPAWQEIFLVQRTSGFRSLMTNSGPKDPSDFQSPDSPRAFKFKWPPQP